MYHWLLPALDRDATVVTASRRLARMLGREHAAAMVERGHDAWATPRIVTYGRWLSGLLQTLGEGRQAYCLGPAQARVLWEECIAAELGEQHANLGAVVRAEVDAWKLVHAYAVPLEEVSSCIDSRDQGVFARAAARYAGRLEEQGWLDEAQLNPAVVAALEDAPAGRIPHSVVLAGFDRLTTRNRSVSSKSGSWSPISA